MPSISSQGGTGRILEYFGPGVEAQSCTGTHFAAPCIRAQKICIVGLATIANMGAEVGATTSTFPYTKNMQSYLYATGRGPVARAADEAAKQGFLSADEGAGYDEVIEIVRIIMIMFFAHMNSLIQNLSNLEPMINGPFTPDLATPLSKFGTVVRENGWKDELSASLIGSCTNSSYEDLVNSLPGTEK